MNYSDLSIVLPCKNEEENIGEVIKDILMVFGTKCEIIIVDNNSTDNSVKIVESFNLQNLRVVRQPIQGYGASIVLGVQTAKNPFVLISDCDGTYDMLDAKKLYILRNHADMILGNRIRYGFGMKPLHRFVGVPLLSSIGNLAIGSDIQDWHSGMRIFKREDFLSFEWKETNFNFASEMITKFTNSFLSIKEYPISLCRPKHKRSPKLHTISDGTKCLLFLLKQFFT